MSEVNVLLRSTFCTLYRPMRPRSSRKKWNRKTPLRSWSAGNGNRTQNLLISGLARYHCAMIAPPPRLCLMRLRECILRLTPGLNKSWIYIYIYGWGATTWRNVRLTKVWVRSEPRPGCWQWSVLTAAD